MTGFAKLFGSIIHSTIWRAPDNVRLVWITMLAIKDIDGVVEASIPGLAHAAGQTIEETEDALAMLMAPDPYSRTPDHEGRRIAIVDGGWLVLNHDKYRDKLDKEESHRKKVARQTRWKDGRRRRPEAVGVAERRSEAVGGAGRPHTDTDTDARSGQSARSVSDPCGSGSSQLPDPDLGGRRDLVQGRGGAREAGFRVPQPSELQVATSAPVGARPVPVDPMVAARGALVRELGAQHRAAFNRARDDLRSKVPPMAAIGDPAERALADLVREQVTLEGFAERARHVLAVREAEALKQRTVKFFGASMWRPDNFATAVSMEVGEDRKGPAPRSAFAVADEVFDQLEARELEGKPK